VPCLSS